MTIDEFRAKAEACTNMMQLEELFVGQGRGRKPLVVGMAMIQIYQARKRELEGDGKTGEQTTKEKE